MMALLTLNSFSALLLFQTWNLSLHGWSPTTYSGFWMNTTRVQHSTFGDGAFITYDHLRQCNSLLTDSKLVAFYGGNDSACFHLFSEPAWLASQCAMIAKRTNLRLTFARKSSMHCQVAQFQVSSWNLLIPSAWSGEWIYCQAIEFQRDCNSIQIWSCRIFLRTVPVIQHCSRHKSAEGVS